MLDPVNLYALLQQKVAAADLAEARVEQVLLGLNWSLATIALGEARGHGLSFSPLDFTRTLPWSGTLAGQPAMALSSWLSHWHPCEAVVGGSITNAVINAGSRCLAQAQTLIPAGPPHLAVFEHFASQLAGARVAVIGRYPGLQALPGVAEWVCIERRPGADDLPDPAADFVLPQMDWVFITASSIANKTLPRLLQLSRQAQVVLMGPSLPWMREWADFGVNHLAGVAVRDAGVLQQVIAEGGGTRIFAEGVGYSVLALS